MIAAGRAEDGASPSAPASAAAPAEAARGELPPGVLIARVGAGANCSSAGSAIDVLFYTSVLAGMIAVALAAAFPPKPDRPDDRAEGGAGRGPTPAGDDPGEQTR